MPRGVTSPMPVTTTRRIPFSRTAGRSKVHGRKTSCDDDDTERRSECDGSTVRFDKADRILDRYDLFRRVVRDLTAEFLFESHHKFYRVEAVGAEIIDKAGILGHFRFVDAQVFDHDLFDPLGDVAHPFFPSVA